MARCFLTLVYSDNTSEKVYCDSAYKAIKTAKATPGCTAYRIRDERGKLLRYGQIK